MSFNQPPRGPYGQQPQQPGPYGQPGQGGTPGQPGYGYPQQPNLFGHQPPQGGYGATPPGGHPGQQQPYGQGGYPPPPPSGGGKGKAIGITIAALAVVGAIIGGFFLISGGDDDDSAAGNEGSSADSSAGSDNDDADAKEDGTHKLQMPNTIGDYSKMDDNAATGGPGSGMDNTAMKRDLEKFGVKNPDSAVGTYSTVDMSDPGSMDPGAMDSMKVLVLMGGWGQIDDPDSAVDNVLAGEDGGSTVELQGSAESVSGSGLDGAVAKCQSATIKNPSPGQASDTIVCAWADNSTLGMVMPMSMAGDSVSKDEAAKDLGAARAAARVES